MARILVAGAVSITITEQRTPSWRAAKATPCAALPALTVHTPSPSAAAGIWRSTLYAPRILAKLRLLRGFDDIEDMLESGRHLTLDAGELGELLGGLGIE